MRTGDILARAVIKARLRKTFTSLEERMRVIGMVEESNILCLEEDCKGQTKQVARTGQMAAEFKIQEADLRVIGEERGTL